MTTPILHYTANSLSRMGMRGVLDNGTSYPITDCESLDGLLDNIRITNFSLLIINDIPLDSELASLVKTIRLEIYKLPILLIADTINPLGVLSTINNGIQGFLTKECDRDEIIHAVHSLIKGERFFCNNVLNILLNKDVIAEEDCNPTTLTEREIEIIQEVGSGLTSKQIGIKLHISAHTVQTHRKNIMRKLKVSSVSELLLYAIRTGLVKSEA
jgi:DNA-binding NarL/FixJ family response regulator